MGREAVALHYDALDDLYRDVWGEHVHHGLWLRGDETRAEAVRQLVELVAGKARIMEGSRVCDIGCGYGAPARMLAQEYGAHVTAITLSSAQFAFARQRNRDESNPSFLLDDWMTIDLSAESFDAAIAIESSEHMPDQGRFFERAHRVLRPGGRLVVCAWLSAEEPGPAQQRWLLEPICREGRMPQLGSASDYQALAEKEGFALLGFEDLTRAAARTWPAIVGQFIVKLLSHPGYLRFLRHAHNRIFALTILRIWIAYRTGAMRYGLFTFIKSSERNSCLPLFERSGDH